MFNIYRKIGTGDLEHVRAQLLQVAAFDKTHLIEQLKAAYKLGDELGMMTRVHINFDSLTEAERTQVLNLFFSNSAHQLEPWEGLGPMMLGVKAAGADLVIETETTKPRLRRMGSAKAYAAEVHELYEKLKEAWLETGGRFTNGNFAKKTALQLASENPELAGSYL